MECMTRLGVRMMRKDGRISRYNGKLSVRTGANFAGRRNDDDDPEFIVKFLLSPANDDEAMTHLLKVAESH